MQQSITQVTHRYTSNIYTANQWLRSLPDTIACDFEAALIYTPSELESFKAELETSTDKYRIREITAALKASALSHPAYVTPTHLSVAWSDSEAFVIILDSPKITALVMTFLTTTTRTQIWHNLSYDAKLIFHHTGGKFPINYEDTALLAKCLLNHVEIQKAGVRLKDLMGYKYGSWAVSSDNFDLSMQYNEDLIKYAAIDACATFALWEQIQSHIKEETSVHVP